MSNQTDLSRISVADFAERFRGEMVPLSNTFSYFSALPLAEDEVKEYLEEPIAALPPAVRKALPKTSVLLVPYLERAGGKGCDIVCFEAPPDTKLSWAARLTSDSGAVIALPTKTLELGDYHYQLLLHRRDHGRGVERGRPGKVLRRAARGIERPGAWRSG